MKRSDVIAAREQARRFADLCDQLLDEKAQTYDADKQQYRLVDWQGTWQIAGKVSGAQRRASMDLTRALSKMRNS